MKPPGKDRARFWGLLAAGQVHSLRKARTVADAYIAACTKRNSTVVYRVAEHDTWRTYSDDTPVTTQLEFDWKTR
ncbi:hypothetical protein ACFWU5_18950 [Nocardia sp. NPDC058640]|uniref:hypothetical protein n=1 Tax=Nocardia sp. NPDC058640 TaxID=3346571 RepID=UPI003656F630